ncbi:MAG: hypothetical protein ACRD1V_21580 [Vicinamibacterales bacterium]
MRSRATPVACVALLLLSGAAGHVAARQAAVSIVFQGEDIEHFLKDAPITAIKDLPTGVTKPRKATLVQNGITRFGVFKTIDEQPATGVQTLEDGTVEAYFQDSWRTEVAAYELDKLIGLGLVPTTVPRTYDGKTGSMQLWVDNIMDEKKRQATHTAPPDPAAWNDQMAKLFVWDNLIYNTDRNLDNILITSSWQLVAIDHSRTFRPFGNLKNPQLVTRVSRSLLARMDALDGPTLKSHLSPYLSPIQIQGILKRRDALDRLVKQLVLKNGEAAVLYN